MTRWEQIEKLCQSALELEESRRRAFLEEACGDDEELRREVESLLRFDGPGEQFIEEPALDVAAKMIAHDKPESLVGQQIGSYQILSLLGTGGMGVVYQARDTRLKRSVAIKVLPRDKTSDPERKKRFIQEARAASALNHPNIITIHDIGSEDGTDFIVMEYVAGKTLDQRIPRKGMRVNEALKLAIQMTDALSKAHAAGIIHRDLKPTNVMVTDEGLVKVLDFGLAKLTEVSGGDETETHTLQSETQEGMIIGTLSYMSPEQAEGKKVDARSDIFSFGAVLYEMVSGQKAFEGDSKISTLAAIVKQDPKPISQLVSDIPLDLEKIINRCLRKDPGRRFQHMADVRVALQELKEEPHSGVVAGVSSEARPIRRSRVWVGAALVIVVMAVGVWFFRWTARKPVLMPEVVPLTSYPGIEHSPNFSPDGNQVVFSWDGEKQDNTDIYIKLIGSPMPVRLTTDPAEDISPAFSPDGRSIGFIRVSKERSVFIVIPSIGGPERIVGEIGVEDFPGFNRPTFAWFPDGKWVVTEGLTLLSTESGETRNLTSRSARRHPDFCPAVSPDGRTVAFGRCNSLDWSDIYLLDLTEDLKPRGQPRRLTSLKGYSNRAAWTPDGREIIVGYFFFGSKGSLWRVSASGTREAERLMFTSGDASFPAISPRGNRLGYELTVFDPNIWRLALSHPGVASGSPTRLIASTQVDCDAQYSPDGKRIAFVSDRSGAVAIWVSDADGSNAVDLISQAGASCANARWSPNGQRIAFNSDPGGNTDIYVISSSGGKPIRLTTDPADDEARSWSRDGNWIYFISPRTGRFEVWKVLAGGGKEIQVTRNGGGMAFESPDGKSLYYAKGGGLWRMPVSGGEESQVLPAVSCVQDFCVAEEGIYFIAERTADRKFSIQFLNFATGKVKTVAVMLASPMYGLSVSPDGRSILFSQIENPGVDLMLVENFR